MTGRTDARWDQWKGCAAAPPLVVRTLDGDPLSLDSFKGRRVVLNFWATWCGPCRKEAPHLDRLARETDVVVLAVSDEEAGVVRTFAEKHDLDYTFALEGELSAPWTACADPDERVPRPERRDPGGPGRRARLPGAACARDGPRPRRAARPAPAPASPPSGDEDED